MTDPAALNERLRQLERETERNVEYRHGIRGELAAVKTELAVVHTELQNLRKDQEEAVVATNARLQGIGRWLMFAGTTFVALAGMALALLARGL